jgi:hypothetical protein
VTTAWIGCAAAISDQANAIVHYVDHVDPKAFVSTLPPVSRSIPGQPG